MATVSEPNELHMAGVFIENRVSLGSSRSSSKLEGSLSYLPETTTGHCGPGSSVGIATDYGLDGSGSNPGGDEIFRPSRPALGPTQPPVQWVPDLSRG